MSRLLVRMEEAGVIARSTSGDDRRSMEIAMTDAGQIALLSAIDSHLELVASLFTDRLTATDRVALARNLHKLLRVRLGSYKARWPREGGRCGGA